MRRVTSRVGEKFGEWLVLKQAPTRGKSIYWFCQCRCGKIKEVASVNLVSGKSTICRACATSNRWTKENAHRQSETRAYSSWCNMMRRCRSDPYYLKKEITVCERWHKFENFLEDMGQPPEGKSIDRIKNAGNYEPGNCKWSTHQEQMNNQDKIIKTIINGETMSLREAAKRSGIVYSTAMGRHKRGWKNPLHKE